MQCGDPRCGHGSGASADFGLPRNLREGKTEGNTIQEIQYDATWKKKGTLFSHCLRRRDIISTSLKGFYSMEKNETSKELRVQTQTFNAKRAKGSASTAGTGCRKSYWQWGDSL